MEIRSFTVQGFANLTAPVQLGPLARWNVVYGANNAGKSNLLRAVQLYLALLGAGDSVSRSQSQTLERPTGGLQDLLSSAFHWSDPMPILFDVEWSIPESDLEKTGLFPEAPCATVRTVLELRPVSRALELRVQKWVLEDQDVAAMDRGRQAAVIGFAQQLRRLLSDARPFQFDLPVPPYRRVGDHPEPFPQWLRDALFDSRQSMSGEARKRWALFAELAGSLSEELGPGAWETTFDRESGRADLIYIQGEAVLTPERMSAGVRRLAGLAAEIALAQEPHLCLEEPEWRLSPALQTRLGALAHRAIQAGLGPRQFYITTHSPATAALGPAFLLAPGEDGPVLELQPWTSGDAGGAPASTAAPAEEEGGGLGDLIGLVEELAELEPDALLPPDENAAVRVPHSGPEGARDPTSWRRDPLR